MKSVQELQKKHPTFIYHSYSYELQQAEIFLKFHFSIPPSIEFFPKVIIPIGRSISQIDNENFENLVFHLGLMEIPSYWKVACSPNIQIQAGKLSKLQEKWFHTFLLKGMGEYFFTNSIDFTKPGFVDINSEGKQLQKNVITNKENKRHLFLNGGGKDSVVGIETLKLLNLETSLLMLNPTKKMVAVQEKSGLDGIAVRRQIDPTLLELNANGYLNGHTPFSAYLAFLGLVVAHLFDFSDMVTANERSSDQENTTFQGKAIIHQYSKTLEFERSLRDYLQETTLSTKSVYSLLRPLWEIQIAKLFSKHADYFSYFQSCNVGQRSGEWCRNCPKCLSTFMLLYPFIPWEIKSIMSENLYKNHNLLPLLKNLLGMGEIIPFECVATVEELELALYLSICITKKTNAKLPALLDWANQQFDFSKPNWEKRKHSILTDWGYDEFIPQPIRKNLRSLLT